MKSNLSEATNYLEKIKILNHKILLDCTANLSHYGRSLLGSHECCLVFYVFIFTNKQRLYIATSDINNSLYNKLHSATPYEFNLFPLASLKSQCSNVLQGCLFVRRNEPCLH